MSFVEEILDSNVSAHAKIIAIAICRYRNRKTGQCFPSLQLLSETLQLSQNTIQKCLRELEAEKIIKISKVRKFTSFVNSYVFLTENKALPKIDTSNIDVSKNDTSNIDASVDTSNHTSKFDYKPIEPTEPNPPTPLIQDCAEPKKDDDEFLKKAKARFGEENLRQAEIQYKNKIKEEIEFYKKESKRVLEIAKDHMAGFIDLTSPAIHEPKEFYEMLKMGYTAKEIGAVIENIIEKQTEAGKNLSIKSWAYVKAAVMNFYKDKI